MINQDKDATREFYSRMVPFKTSLTGTIEPPAECVSVPEHAGQVGQDGGQRSKARNNVGASVPLVLELPRWKWSRISARVRCGELAPTITLI